MFQSWRLLARVKPQVVLGVGGYASGPALLAAWMTFRRFAVQEQNAIPGMTNKFLGRFATAVFVGFEAARKHFPKPQRVIVSGNPLRKLVTASLGGQSARAPGEPGTLSILVFGGSQGARFLNENVPAAIAALHAKRPELKLALTHQTGPTDEELTQERYDALPFASVTPYIDDMPAAYSAADVAICRAGALTVAELTAVALPAFMVPFPYAAYNHQVDNASELVEAGAGAMMEQRSWDQATLVAWLEKAADDRAALATMSAAAQSLARVDAAATVVDHLERIAKPAKNGAAAPIGDAAPKTGGAS
jgi:UDP-N-acetylglucosamine--N-acetylmuramyl-(pentapeptide) pyrophosphoryl-undecaprenol N-acetylglucosamine transferase